MENTMQTIYNRIDNSRILQSIRSGLVMMIPILLIGSFSLVLRSLPIAPYQRFITSFLSGAVYSLFTFVHNATFGFLAVYMTIAIAICFMQQEQPSYTFSYGPVFTSLVCFCIFSGLLSDSFTVEALGVNGMFTAIVCSLGASSLYSYLGKRLPRFTRLYTDGYDGEFSSAISTIFPTLLVILAFALVNLLFVLCFKVNGFQTQMVNFIIYVFSRMGRSLVSALCFILLSSILWFFGVHGNDLLDPVSQNIFGPVLDLNPQLLMESRQATEIFSKPFFDVFVFMGGCGTTLCLLLSLALFSRYRSNHNLAKMAALPMVFNINEIMVFGLPIVFNPLLLLPFVITPLVTALISFAAMYAGLVPVPIANVAWTTPIFLGGYLATGSLAGSALQLFNLVVGTLIYRPFILGLDMEKLHNAKLRMENLTQLYQKSEEECHPLELLALHGSLGNISKTLAEEITFHTQKHLPTLFYQPQYDCNGNCIGAEALLRWQNPLYGTLYPPLVIKLADEIGRLNDLEKMIFISVIKDMDQLIHLMGENAKISVNVSGTTVQTTEFEEFLVGLQREYPSKCAHICIEITEQTALQINETQINRLSRIHALGYSLAIDDFSMGSTSIKYLQFNVFDLIKLDGSLSKDVLANSRSRDIVASITALSKNFGIQVLAEYVETEKQRDLLESIGCHLYQGYLYSPAVPLGNLEQSLHSFKNTL